MTPPGVAAGMRALLARRDAELGAGGAEPVGWKVGFNLPAVWPALGIDAPVAGYLTSATVVAPGSEVAVGGWTRPTLEPEIAITVGEDDTVAALAPAIEVVDVDLPFEDVEAILARNIFHRAVAFGEVAAVRPRPSDVWPGRSGPALEGFSCEVRLNGKSARSEDSTEAPIETVRRVSGFLREHGAELRPGDRIIAGTLTPPLPVAAGDEVEVDLGALGSVGLRFG